MRSVLVLAVLAAACTAPGGLDLPPATEHHNVGSGGLALEGYDPVAYFPAGGGAARLGDPAITTERDGLTYRFATEANRQRFLADPAHYLPAYGGWCAWAMVDGERVAVDPESWLIEEGRLLLFYDGLFGDTRRQWLEADGPLRPSADDAWESLTAGGVGGD